MDMHQLTQAVYSIYCLCQLMHVHRHAAAAAAGDDDDDDALFSNRLDVNLRTWRLQCTVPN